MIFSLLLMLCLKNTFSVGEQDMLLEGDVQLEENVQLDRNLSSDPRAMFDKALQKLEEKVKDAFLRSSSDIAKLLKEVKFMQTEMNAVFGIMAVAVIGIVAVGAMVVSQHLSSVISCCCSPWKLLVSCCCQGISSCCEGNQSDLEAQKMPEVRKENRNKAAGSEGAAKKPEESERVQKNPEEIEEAQKNPGGIEDLKKLSW